MAFYEEIGETLSMISTKRKQIEDWLLEDAVGLGGTAYWQKLPQVPVQAVLKVKSDLVLAGMPWFIDVFDVLQPGMGAQMQSLLEWEGKILKKGTDIAISSGLLWCTAITGERLALNLLQRASAVATETKRLVEAVGNSGVKVLDTRKTTPGLRELEKYAVTVAGGHNHRFQQTDVWMIKDNHKELLGLRGAVEFFRNLGQPYKNIIVEIHDQAEMSVARSLGVRHFLLDNFSEADLKTICASKQAGEFFEVSGNITVENVSNRLIPGVDAVSSGKLTQFPPPVDLSFKFKAV